MARPVRRRRICFEPKYDNFAPCGAKSREQILLTVDEFGAVRLIDHEKKTHEQCARQMGISRSRMKILDPSPVPILEKERLNAREQKKVGTGLRKWEIAKEAQQLKRFGKNNTEIAKALQISRPTVLKYLAMTKLPII